MRKVLVLVAALICLGLAATTEAEVTQHGSVRVNFDGQIVPRKLPRHGMAPVKVQVSTRISSAKADKAPPQLQTIRIAINRYGVLDAAGLPVCEMGDIQPATTANALEACRDSLVGQGTFAAKVLLPEQTPFPSNGKVYAFNGVYKGKPAILAHVYGTDPAPTSFTLPFVITRAHGTYGTTLSASFPRVTSNWGYMTGLSLSLYRRYQYKGKSRSYLSASCPAPKGSSVAAFSFARASFGFEGRTLNAPPLVRSCAAR